MMLTLFLAILFGFSMKVSDLLADDGLKLFKFDGVFFGGLTGLCGIFLIFSDYVIANIIFAMYLGFLIRNKLDHFNHRLGAIFIFIGFASSGLFNKSLFYLFFFLVFLITDSIYDFLKAKQYNYYFITELVLPFFCLIFCIHQKYSLIIFYAFFLYICSYNITKMYALLKLNVIRL
jgi:hypothetical protein